MVAYAAMKRTRPCQTPGAVSLDQQSDDYLVLLRARLEGEMKHRGVVAQLSDDLSLQAVYEFTWQQFLKARSWDKRMSAWYVGCSARRLAMGKKLL